MQLSERLEALGQDLAKREARHQSALEDARAKAGELHGRVEAAVTCFNAAVSATAPHLKVALSEPRSDDKHVHATQFDLRRGRYRAIVTVKSKGEVTLVGPFRDGKSEGPCRSFAFGAKPDGEGSDFDDALGEFLERFVEEAATP